MDYTASQQTQIRFSAQTEYGRYTDALYYPEGKVPDEKTRAAELHKAGLLRASPRDNGGTLWL